MSIKHYFGMENFLNIGLDLIIWYMQMMVNILLALHFFYYHFLGIAWRDGQR